MVRRKDLTCIKPLRKLERATGPLGAEVSGGGDLLARHTGVISILLMPPIVQGIFALLCGNLASAGRQAQSTQLWSVSH